MKKDASLIYFNKVTRLVKNCSNCDALVIYVKPEKIDNKSSYTYGKNEDVSPAHKIIYGKVYIYRNGELRNESDIYSLNRFIPLPIISLITWNMKEKNFEEEISLFQETMGHSEYQRQFAFFFSHKVSDAERRQGSFSSSTFTEFSLKSYLKGINSLSSQINGRHRPYDILFLSQCLSSIETIYEVYKANSAKLVFSVP